MDKTVLIPLFRTKLEENYQAYMSEWLMLDPTALIENAEKIAIIKQIYRYLMEDRADVCYTEDHEYLLRFKNPLEVIYDELVYEGYKILDSDLVSYSVWTLHDRSDAECDYEVDSMFAQQEHDEELEV